MMELDTQVRLRVDSKDEIGDLKEQINSLYQHLLTVIADLHNKNEAIHPTGKDEGRIFARGFS